jgi:Holliday junction resolvase-like predicted endonuclease
MSNPKSPRHSKITGDFAEGLMLYWLSKYGYECARIDHVGIDLIARSPDGKTRLGISVKCRSRLDKNPTESVRLDGFEKVEAACKSFGLAPYFAVVVDGANTIRGFLVSLDRLRKFPRGMNDDMRYWQMKDKDVGGYNEDALIEKFELKTVSCSWRDRQPANSV